MKLKLNDDGNAVLSPEGQPIYVNEDGSEVAWDAPRSHAKISELNAENSQRRHEAAQLQAQLAEAKAALEAATAGTKTPADTDVQAALQQQLQETKKQLDAQERKYKAQVRDMLLESAFNSSPWIRENVAVPLDLLRNTFAGNFKVEHDDETGPRVVARNNGTIVMSQTRIGEQATFDEAIQQLVLQMPGHETVLKATRAGAGTGQGTAGTEGKDLSTMSSVEKSALLQRIGPEAYQALVLKSINK